MNSAVPFRLRHESGGLQIEWVRTHDARFTEPFFEDTIMRIARAHPSSRTTQRERTPLAALEKIPPGLAPTALIFHVSRCGSTLISQMLRTLAGNHVISEPPVVDDILQTARYDPTITDDYLISWLRGAVHALGATRSESIRYYMKLDCWHLFSLPLIKQAFPGVPLLFVHRHPVPVLVSLMQMPSLTLVRDTVALHQLGMTAADRDALSPEAHAAAILGAFYREACLHCNVLVSVAYEQLPAFVWESMPGGPFTPEECQQLQAAAKRDAKNPASLFTADSVEKHHSATPAIRAASARWAEPHYARWLTEINHGATQPLGVKCTALPSAGGSHSIRQ